MAWTAPMTWVDGTPLTAAQLNTHLRDNLLETAPAKATVQDTSGRYFVTSGANQIAERRLIRANVSTGENTTSTSFTDLATVGPTNTSLDTGIACLILFGCSMSNTGSGNTCRMGFEISGATSLAAGNTRSFEFTTAAANQGIHAGSFFLAQLTAGSNTFQAKYMVTAGTGTFQFRELYVMPF
jgi:hypothetical protein